ncbi:MAG: NADH-quinone oxidoreductase subunit N [Elusimicrobiales bacterium]|nr:NADH-quinone oxidoreductase subunit N [Elusimicrobiales bacterium]
MEKTLLDLIAPLLLAAVPAIIALLVRPAWAQRAAGIGLAAALFNVFISAPANILPFGQSLVYDPLTKLFWLLILGAALAAVVLTPRAACASELPANEYYFLLPISAVGLMAMLAAGDLIGVFIALEVVSLPLYALAAARRTAAGAEAGYKYFLLGSFGAALTVLGIAFFYGSVGSALITSAAAIAGLTAHQAAASAGFLLIMAGFAFKAALVPFHMWVPDVYEGSPSPVGAFMASAVKAGAVLVLFRLFVAADLPLYYKVFWWVAALTMAAGNIAALPQTGVKRMLAYSSVAHAGYLLTGFMGGKAAFPAVYFYLAVYAAATIGAFSLVAILEKEEKGVTLDGLRGLAAADPAKAALMAVFVLSLAGIPPLAGFFGKFWLFAQAVRGGSPGLVVIAVLASAVSLYYYLSIMTAMYAGKGGASDAPRARTPFTLWLLGAFVLFGGLAADLFLLPAARALPFLP